MSISNLFKSKAFQEGWQAGKNGKTEIDNPYSDAATEDNLSRGMGASPWWDTAYKPFIDWRKGMIDARRKEVDAYLKGLDHE